MKFAYVLTVMVSLTVGSVFAQDFDNIQLLNTVSHTALPAASGQAAPGPQAPWGYSHGGYYPSPYQDPYRQGLEWRYSSVQQGLKHYAGYYGWFSREREYYSAQLRQGEDLWVRYLRYRDAWSAAALQQWISYWESSMYYGQNWNTGNYNGGYYNSGYYDYDYDYRYRRGGYYDHDYDYSNYHRYPRGSWGYQPWYANDNFVHGVGIGNGVAHIINGSRTRNDLQTIGGVLSTAGNLIGVIDHARRY